MNAFEIILRVLLTIVCVLLGIFILHWLLVIISSLFIDEKKEYTKHSRYYRMVLNGATGPGLFLSGVNLKVEGKELIPEGKQFLMVSNHRSKFDPIVEWYVFRKNDLSFISKPSNFKVPFFGKIVHRLLFLPIDREDPRKAITTINKAAEFIKADEVSFGVYPEGTRSKTLEILPFHNGVFKIAQKANVPIIVSTIQGTENIAKNFPFKRTKVLYRIVGVIPAEEIKGVSTAEIGERITKMFKDNIDLK